jgi:hypothetical protein
MNSATTQAKIGLSMKKLGMDAYRWTEADRDFATPSEASAASTKVCGFTLSPATNF